MAHDDSLSQISSKKRALQAEETSGASRKLETDEKLEEDTSSKQCCDHLEEIGRLKQELSKGEMADSNHCCHHLKEMGRLKEELSIRDFQITTLDKMIAGLKKKRLKRIQAI